MKSGLPLFGPMRVPRTYAAFGLVCALFVVLMGPMQRAGWEWRALWVAVAGAAGGGLWWRSRVEGAALVSGSVAAGWITLLSYPAGVSLLPMFLIYIGLMWLVLLPWKLRRCRPFWLWLWPAVLCVWIVATPPARRYSVAVSHPEIQQIAAGLADPEEAVAFVHSHVRRTPAPPTDTAVDTLRRAEAHCGGMSNLLHALLLEMDYPARIVHLIGEGKGDIHTLVEVEIAGETFLADPQVNRLDPLRAEQLIGMPPQDSWPGEWRGMKSVYDYVPRRGYVRRWGD